ncbi:MAG: Uma2 family endonuclease [Spirochaetaceae bacterium]|nr:Uma2 family endonuclease [Spirochaetaceae bacterium]
MGALPQEQEEHFFTYADYKEWELDEGERFELINGEAYAMSGPNTRHQEILMALSSQFYNYLQGKPCKVYPAPFDVRLFYEEDESDDTVVQPDITVICDEKKRGYEGCRGAPDLVIEILSPSNTAIEMERKLKLYQEAGVREYWIVDPENNGVTVYRFQEGAIPTYLYKSADTVPVGIFPDLNIALEQVFAG